MARLILPRQYSQQPSNIPTLARHSSVVNGLVEALTLVGDRWIAVTPRLQSDIGQFPFTEFTGPTPVFSQYGRGRAYNATAFSRRDRAPYPFNISALNLNEVSQMLLCIPTLTSTASVYAYGFGNSASTNDVLGIGQGITAGRFDWNVRDHAGTQGGVQNVAVSAWSTNVPALIICRRSARQNIGQVFFNGQPAAATTAAALSNVSFDRTTVGALTRTEGAGASSLKWTGQVFLAVTWNRCLTDAEIASLSVNPWQIFDASKSIVVNLPSSGTTITPDIFVNSQTFFGPTIKTTVKPGLFTNVQAFFGPTLKATLKPAIFTNAQSFYSPKLTLTLKPSLFVNSQTFYGTAVSVAGSTKLPSLFVNTNTFYAPTIRLKLYPSIFANSQTFYSPRVATVGSSDFPIGYWELKQAIKTVLDVQLAALSPVPKVVVEDDMIPSESWVGIYQDDRRAPVGVQELSRGKRTRMQVRHTIWVWRYAMKPSDAIRLRDSLLGDVELALMVDPTFGGQCEGSWMNGGRMIAADGDKPGLYYAGGEIELICEALARVN